MRNLVSQQCEWLMTPGGTITLIITAINNNSEPTWDCPKIIIENTMPGGYLAEQP
jgi:hypothetical protein